MALGDFLMGGKAKADEAKAKAEAAELEKAKLEAGINAVLVTTGDLQAKYQPVKIVFAVGGSIGGWFKSASPQEAFEVAVHELRRAAFASSGHAVVYCSFGYNATERGFTVHGYGTVVRFS